MADLSAEVVTILVFAAVGMVLGWAGRKLRGDWRLLRDVRSELGELRSVVDNVDDAVNRSHVHEPKLKDRVQHLEQSTVDLQTTVATLDGKVDQILEHLTSD